MRHCVTGKGESADDPESQEAMIGEQVLDVKKYHDRIAGTSVTAKAQRRRGADRRGRLTIHGVTKPVTAPVAVRIDGAALTTTGKF
jgi:polyisoprenoid-binding protein YceI